MAHINTLKGGYTGKLGDTIGQHPRSKYVVKAYAKPSNPRTPAQQANRRRFAVANDYVNSLKMLGSFPEIEGQEKCDFQAQRIQYFLQNINSLKKSLRGLQYKNYEENDEVNVNYTFECQETDFVLSLDAEIYTDEDDSPYQNAVLCYVIYDYEQQKLIYGESEAVNFEWHSSFGGYYAAIIDVTIERSSDFTRRQFPIYAFAKFDGTPYNSTYENVDVN